MESESLEAEDFFSKLPEDLVIYLLPYLNYMDMFCLSETSQHIKNIFLTIKYRKIYLKCDFRLNNNNFGKAFENRVSFETVKELDLSGIYWIPKQKLWRIIYYFKCVENVKVLGTKIEYIPRTEREKLPKTKILDFFYLGKYKSCESFHINVIRFCRKAISEPFESEVMRFDEIDDWDQFYKAEWDGVSSDTEEQYFFDMTEMSIPVETKNMSVRSFNSPNNLRSRKPERCIEEYFISFKDLEKVTIEIPVGCSSNMLKHVFTGCDNLKYIKLLSKNPSIKLSYLEYATNLEHLSFTITNGDFMLDKFFLDVITSKMKLKRISLRFQNCPKIDKNILDSFLEESPELMLLWIQCEIPNKAIKEIQSTFRKYTREDPRKLYFIKKLLKFKTFVSIYDMLPIVHWDLVNNNDY